MVTGIATGLFLVFGPTYTECRSPLITAGGPAIGSEVCGQSSMWQLQGLSGFPAPYLFIVVWSLAPIIGFAAAWLVSGRASRIWLGGLTLATEASVLISFGAGPLYILLVFPLVLIAFLALLNIRDTRNAAKQSEGVSSGN